MQVNEKRLDQLLQLVEDDNGVCPENEDGEVIDCKECWKNFLKEKIW
jgi:hypothetical protein